MTFDLDELLEWAAQFPPCAHEERVDFVKGKPKDTYRQIVKRCTVCDDEEPTARVLVWR